MASGVFRRCCCERLSCKAGRFSFVNPPSIRTSTNAATRQSDEREGIKPFSEIPGEGSSNPMAGIVYAIKGWRAGSQSRKPWNSYDRWEEKYGTIYKRVFGNNVTLFLSDPDDIETVFRSGGTQPIRFEDTYFDILNGWRYYKKKEGLPGGLFTAKQDTWHRERKPLSKKMLRPMEVAKSIDKANYIMTDFIEKIYERRNEVGIVEGLEELTFLWSLEFIVNVVFSKRLHLLDGTIEPEAQGIIDGVNNVFKTTAELYKFPAKYQAILYTKTWKVHSKAWDAIFEFERKRISEKEEELRLAAERGDEMDPGEMDIITQLLTKSDLSYDEIYLFLSEVLLGSIDMTSNTLHWALHSLATNRSVQWKLSGEVADVIPKGEVPTSKHLSKMPYLKSVVKETLRLYPAIPYINRTMKDDIVLQGYHIPAGTPLLMLLYKSSRNERYFKDALQFKPERWLTKEHDKSFATMPFGFGPRMCIGKRLAELQLQLAVARISSHFVVQSTSRVQHIMEMTIKPDRDLNLNFTDRRSLKNICLTPFFQ